MKYTRTKHVGLVCPQCGCRHIPVSNTYRIADGLMRRYRRCRHCDRVFITTEKIGVFAPPVKSSLDQSQNG